MIRDFIAIDFEAANRQPVNARQSMQASLPSLNRSLGI